MANSSNYWKRRDQRIDEILESWKTLASFAGVALKSAILLNGAAAVAILAFIANQADGGSSLVASLRFFVYGVLSASLATAFGYLSAYAENQSLWRWVEDKEKLAKVLYRVSGGLQVTAIALVAYAYLQFWFGTEAGRKPTASRTRMWAPDAQPTSSHFVSR